MNEACEFDDGDCVYGSYGSDDPYGSYGSDDGSYGSYGSHSSGNYYFCYFFCLEYIYHIV